MEADAIKSKDVVYQQLRSRMATDSSVDAYVHEYSTAAAELMLVTAVNQQKVSVLLSLLLWTGDAVPATLPAAEACAEQAQGSAAFCTCTAVRPMLAAVHKKGRGNKKGRGTRAPCCSASSSSH